MSLPANNRTSLKKWMPDSPRDSYYSGSQSRSTPSGYGSGPLWSSSQYSSQSRFASTCPALIQRNKRQVGYFSTTQKLIYGDSQRNISLSQDFKEDKSQKKKKEIKIESWTQMTPKDQKVKIKNAKKDAATQMTPKVTKPAAASRALEKPKDDENKTTVYAAEEKSTNEEKALRIFLEEARHINGTMDFSSGTVQVRVEKKEIIKEKKKSIMKRSLKKKRVSFSSQPTFIL